MNDDRWEQTWKISFLLKERKFKSKNIYLILIIKSSVNTEHHMLLSIKNNVQNSQTVNSSGMKCGHMAKSTYVSFIGFQWLKSARVLRNKPFRRKKKTDKRY